MSTVTAVNTRNQFRGTIVGIHRGDVVSEVEIKTSTGVLNRAHGVELEGLWLSSTCWIDGQRFPLAHAPRRQERQYRLEAIPFA